MLYYDDNIQFLTFFLLVGNEYHTLITITEVFPTTETASIYETQSTNDTPCNLSTDSDLEEVEDQKGGPIAKCPGSNGIEPAFIADSKDCSVFYMCDWGRPNKMRCPGGLHFNSRLGICDWPCNADCTVSV